MTGNVSDISSQKSQTSNSRKLQAWDEGYLTLTKNAPAPMLFKKWAAYFAISSALSRRAWVETDLGPIYANFLGLLVGKPGIGKGPATKPAERILYKIDTTNTILEQFESIHMGPGDCTIAGLFDEFLDEKSHKTFKFEEKTYTFQHVIIIAEELSAFMHHVDNQMMGYLIKFLNCDPHSQRLRGKGETTFIDNPVLSILGGVQPQVLSTIFPPQAFGMGLAARATFIYSSERTKVSPFSTVKCDPNLEADLTHDLRQITKLVGRFKFTEEAEKRADAWWMHESDHDSQKHPKLEAYNSKRILPFFRLCMIHSVSREDNLVVGIEHVEKALADMYEVEATMPHIFDTMTSEGSQSDVFADLAHQITTEFVRTGKPIPYHVAARIASRKVKAYEITGILESLVSQELLQVVQAGLKIPGRDGPKAFIPGKEML